MIKCSRRMFLLGSATTFAGAYAAACGSSPSAEIAATEIPIGSAKIVDGVIFTPVSYTHLTLPTNREV